MPTIKEKGKILLNEFTGEGVTEFPVKSLVHDLQNDKWTNSKLVTFKCSYVCKSQFQLASLHFLILQKEKKNDPFPASA